MIVLAALAFFASRRLELVPHGTQNLMEIVLEQIRGMIDDVMGPQGRPYLPLIATLGLFILAANLMSLVPGLAGPTTNLNTTAACAIVVFVAYHAIGFKEQGAVTYIKHFMGPVVWLAPLMMPIEIISHLARPLSLTLRLFGNMVGGHILLAVIFFLMGLNGLIGWALSGSVAGALPLSAQAAGLVPSGLHLRDAHDALHRGGHRARRGRSRRRAPRFRPSLAQHTYRGGRSCDVH